MFASMCVPVMCRLAVVQLTMQEYSVRWGPLRLCMRSDCTLSVICYFYDIFHNFAKNESIFSKYLFFVFSIYLFFNFH